MSSKPALVFVPGAWHDPACFDPTTAVLASQHGYAVTPVALPSVGSELRNEPAPQDWQPDVSAIRAAITAHLDRDEDIVLIAHSYGGCPASEAARGLSKRARPGKAGIVRLVWISAMALPVGGWPWERTNGKPRYPERTLIKGDLIYVHPDFADDWYYNACTPAQREAARRHLRSLAWKVFTNSRVTYQAWRDMPATYLMCENDHAIDIGAQEAMVAADGDCWDVERCDGDHSPFISRVDFTVDVIRRAAGEGV